MEKHLALGIRRLTCCFKILPLSIALCQILNLKCFLALHSDSKPLPHKVILGSAQLKEVGMVCHKEQVLPNSHLLSLLLFLFLLKNESAALHWPGQEKKWPISKNIQIISAKGDFNLNLIYHSM